MHQTTVRLGLGEVNPYLTCVLCGGYFIDATTITECLHSFCKKCIIVYLDSSKCCPICDTQVHQTKSLLNLRPDKTLQDIVYKLVPGLYMNEMRDRRIFYSDHPDEDPVSREDGGNVRDRMLFDANHKISLCLKYIRSNTEVRDCDTKIDNLNQDDIIEDEIGETKFFEKRYLLCPAAMSIGLLQKFIRIKFELSQQNKIIIFYSDESLHDQMTLADVVYTYEWKEVEPLMLQYQIREKEERRKGRKVPLTQSIEMSEGHTVTSSGRKVKTLCYAETKSHPIKPTTQFKKRKHSGSSGHCSSKTSKKSRCDLPKVDDDEEFVANKRRTKYKPEKRKIRNIFEVLSDRDDPPEVPHIAIKLSKTGDNKDSWSSQPCQILNPYRNACKVKSPVEVTKEHHRKEIEEDSGRGSDVSSPSLLSPSNTDPSMSPPGSAHSMTTPPHDSLKSCPKSNPGSPSSFEYSSHKSKNKASGTVQILETSIAADPVRSDKYHRKRCHKYGSLTVKVPDDCSKMVNGGHYQSVMASIPSPENPLLMKITRQISKPAAMPPETDRSPPTSKSSAMTPPIGTQSLLCVSIPKIKSQKSELSPKIAVESVESVEDIDVGGNSPRETPENSKDDTTVQMSTETSSGESVESSDSQKNIQEESVDEVESVTGNADPIVRSDSNDKASKVIKDGDHFSSATCCRVKPYVSKSKRSNSPSVSTSVRTVADPSSSVSSTTTVTSDTKNSTSPTVSISSPISSSHICLDQDLQALPGLRIPRFIPQATWYNLPKTSVNGSGYIFQQSGKLTPTCSGSKTDSLPPRLLVAPPRSKTDDDITLPGIYRKTQPHVTASIAAGLHHISAQPMMIQAMHRPHLLAAQAVSVAAANAAIKPRSASLAAIWRLPGLPPYHAPTGK